MTLLTMSERELSRLKIIEDINERRLSVVQGAELAGISRQANDAACEIISDAWCFWFGFAEARQA